MNITAKTVNCKTIHSNEHSTYNIPIKWKLNRAVSIRAIRYRLAFTTKALTTFMQNQKSLKLYFVET